MFGEALWSLLACRARSHTCLSSLLGVGLVLIAYSEARDPQSITPNPKL